MPRRNPYLPLGAEVGDVLVCDGGYFGYPEDNEFLITEGKSFDLKVDEFTGQGGQGRWRIVRKANSSTSRKLKGYARWVKEQGL
jgi:hypothetical protein